MLKRLLVVVALLLVIFGGVFGLWYQQMQQKAAAHKPPPPAAVAVSEAREETWPTYLGAVGSLAPVAGIDVTNEVPGKVSAIRFESGALATEGQLLIELDASSDLAELEGLLAAQRLARVKFERFAELLPKKSASKADYDEARALLDVAEAAAEAKRAVIAKKKVLAPFSGRLGIRKVDLGQYLAPGSPIVPLEALSPIYADFSLPERHLASLAVGQKVSVAVQAYPGETFEGRIRALDPGIEQGTRSVKVRAVLENPQERLRPGMFAEVQVLLAADRRVLTIPDTAVTYAPYGDSVFLIAQGEQGPTVQRKQVETGETRQGRVAITSGLAKGDRVVSAGQVKLRNGMPVTLDDKPAPGERGAAKP
jgi:membrane fusion protein (multidrug efflux system)